MSLSREEILNSLTQQARVAFLIQIALTMGILIFAAMTMIIYMQDHLARKVLHYGDDPMLDLMTLVGFIVAVTMALMSQVIPRKILENANHDVSRFTTAIIIRNAMLEGAAMFALVVVFLGVNAKMHISSFYSINLVIPAAVVVYFLISLPTLGRIESRYVYWFTDQ